jgi:hypothetical protein
MRINIFIIILGISNLAFSQKVDIRVKTNAAVNPTALQFFAIPQNLPMGAEITNIVLTVTTTPACRAFLGIPTTPATGLVVGKNGPFPDASTDPNNLIFALVGGWNGYTPNVDNLVASVPISGGSGTCTFTGIKIYSYLGNDGNFYVESGGQGVQQEVFNEAVGIVLPVELLNFAAEKKGNKSVVKWETLGEKNIENFIVERSADGVNYKVLGFERPKAAQAEKRESYEFIDDQPEIGINYYRLQSKGARKEDFKYSKVVSVDFGLGLKAKAFPNPFAAELSIEIDIEQGVKGEVTIDMFDTAGKQVLTKKLNAEGRKLNFEVPTEGLVPGSYVIRVKNGSFTWQHKITKQ